jgi:tRNA(Ile)-lysidine synthase
LAGIPAERPPGFYRPLLPFFREELADYAHAKGIRFLRDPTNLDLGYSRNFLRHRILPQLRDGPIPSAREALLRLGRLAREEEEAWESLLPGLLQGVLLEEEAGIFIVRSGLLAYHPAVRSRLLREVFRRSGIELDEAGTRGAVEFTTSGESGRSLTLPGGMRLTREFDRFRLLRAGGRGEAGSLIIREAAPGSGNFTLQGTRFRVAWGFVRPSDLPVWLEIPRSGVDFPLELRGWEPGDRVSLSYGTKKLKKLLAEKRVPLEDRGRTPVLVDAGGRVLWVPGVASSTLIRKPDEGEAFFLGIGNGDESGSLH